MSDPFLILEPKCSDPPAIIFEVPHASGSIPGNVRIPAGKLTHNHLDIGAHSLAAGLHRQFNSFLIAGEISRLVVDLNRRGEYCCPDELAEEKRAWRIKKYHAPYVKAVCGVIEQFIARGALPIYFGIHTYEPVLNAHERKLFSVMGDPDSVLVQALFKHLKAQLCNREIHNDLKSIGLIPNLKREDPDHRYIGEVTLNDPYDLASRMTEDGEQNDNRRKAALPHYAQQYGNFPWAEVEVLNDRAGLFIVRSMLHSAISAVLDDSAVKADLEYRRLAFIAKRTSGDPSLSPAVPLPSPAWC
jgi:hypothetical protein